MWKSFMCLAGARYLLLTASVTVLAPSVLASDGVIADAIIVLDEAIEKTLSRNLSLIAFGHQIEAQRGRVTQSTLRPNPELGVQVENALGSGALSGIDRAETTLSLAWVLERGKRQAREVAARASVSIFESEADVRRTDVAAETARIFLESLANQELLEQTRNAVTLAKETVEAIGTRVRAGRTPDADLARAEAQLARTQLAHEDVEHELETSNYQLAAQWGEAQPDFLKVSGDIYNVPMVVDFKRLLIQIERNPRLSRYLTEQRLRQAELRLAETEAKPNWRLTAGIRRLEQSDDQAFVAGIMIPLALRNRNQGGIAEARANLAGVEAERTAARLQLETQLFAYYQELQHSLHRVKTLRQKVLPKVEKALADTQRAYASGRYGYFELQLVQNEVLSTQMALVDASIDAHKRLIEIEGLTGTVITRSVKQP
ncbi:MAG: cobalt-zinc-cadmium efflux system outer membrane protein [Candidatus Azotimanducaceae bacterium]|jgi:cobalt-zinc-cadmium efflux system outer membrane protein